MRASPGGVVEVGGADALADDVPVGARGDEGQLLALHDVLQLGPHLADLGERGALFDEGRLEVEVHEWVWHALWPSSSCPMLAMFQGCMKSRVGGIRIDTRWAIVPE